MLIQICQKVYGYVLKRLAKFERNLWVGSCFTMSQSFSMETSFVCKNTFGILTTFARFRLRLVFTGAGVLTDR